MKDDIEVGARLTSGQSVSSFGGNPLSGNQTFTGDGGEERRVDRSGVCEVVAVERPGIGLPARRSAGKMEVPFVVDGMVYDPDWTPTGASAQAGYAFSDRQSVKLITGGFLLSDTANFSYDPYLLGAQLRWDAVWTSKLSTSVGAAGYWVLNTTNLSNTDVPNVNGGNTRDATGHLVYEMRPVVGDASATYTLSSFPLYRGAFPITVRGRVYVQHRLPGRRR